MTDLVLTTDSPLSKLADLTLSLNSSHSFTFLFRIFSTFSTMAEPLGLSLGDLGRLWDTVFPAPWGPLNPVWEHVQRTAAPLDFDHFSVRQWLNYALVPFIPVAIMAYLIVGGPNDKLARETREVRLALGIVGISIATSAYLNNRFYGEFGFTGGRAAFERS